MSKGEVRLAFRKVDDWWEDHRRFLCAYCGMQMRRRGVAPTSATKDHIVPKAHGGLFVTVPACRKCNQAKADKSVEAFLGTAYFAEVRKHKHKYQWPLSELWLAVAREAIAQMSMHQKREAQRGKPVPQPRVKVPPAGFGDLLDACATDIDAVRPLSQNA